MGAVLGHSQEDYNLGCRIHLYGIVEENKFVVCCGKGQDISLSIFIDKRSSVKTRKQK